MNNANMEENECLRTTIQNVLGLFGLQLTPATRALALPPELWRANRPPQLGENINMKKLWQSKINSQPSSNLGRYGRRTCGEVRYGCNSHSPLVTQYLSITAMQTLSPNSNHYHNTCENIWKFFVQISFSQYLYL